MRYVKLDAFSLGIVRLVLAGGAMTCVLLARGQLSPAAVRSWDRRTWKSLLLVGFAFGLHWITFFLSIKLASAAIGAIGFSTYGLHLIVLGWLLGYSRVYAVDAAGLVLALAGTLLLVPEFSLENQHTLGLVSGVASGLAAAVLPLLHQRYVDVDVNLRAWGQFTFALIPFLLFSPLAKWEFTAGDIPWLLYLGLGVAWMGHGMWVHVTSVLSTTTISILSYLYLPTSLVVGYLVLGEQLTGKSLVGTMLVLVANALVVWNQIRHNAISATTVGNEATTVGND